MSNPTVFEKLYLTAPPRGEPWEPGKDPTETLSTQFSKIQITPPNSPTNQHPHQWRILNSPTLGVMCLSLFNKLDAGSNPELAPLEDLIQKVKNEEIKEQLTHLLLVLTKSYSPIDVSIRLKAVYWILSLHERGQHKNIHKIIGLLITSCRYNLPETIHLIHLNNDEQTLNGLYENADRLFRQISNNVLTSYHLHQQFQIPRPENCLSIELGTLLAQFVIDETGHLNHGIFNFLKSQFESHPVLKEAKIHLVSLIFDWCRYFPSFRKELCQISPTTIHPKLAFIIRTTLNLGESVQLEPYHASQAALSMLFSTLRQGSQQNCFATSLSMALRSGNPYLCLSDLKHLFATATMYRNGEHRPFLLRSDSTSLKAPFYINYELQMVKDKTPMGQLIDYPPLQKVLSRLDKHDPKSALIKGLSKLDLNQPVTFQRILIALAQSDSPTFGVHEEEQYQKLLIAFNSTQSHPLGNIWKNVIANTCNWNKSYLKYAANATLTAFIHAVKKRNPLKAQLRDQHLRAFDDIFLKSGFFFYDPSIENRDNGRISHGGFVLYTKEGPVSTQERFLGLIEEILRQANERVKAEHKLLYFESVYTDMIKAIRSTRFMSTLLSTYESYFQYKEGHPPLPWIITRGLDTHHLLESYFEAEGKVQIVQLKSNTPKTLFQSLIHYINNLPESESVVYEKNPHLNLMCRIANFHAFSLRMGHLREHIAPKIKTFEHVYLAEYEREGRKMASSEIQTEIQRHILESISSHYGLNLDHLLSVEQKGLGIYQFSQSLIHKIQILAPSEHRKSIEMIVSKTVVDLLPTYLKQTFASLAVPFADTNWGFGLRDVHWCFVYNPATNDIEIWETDDKLFSFAPFNTSALQTNHWELFRIHKT